MVIQKSLEHFKKNKAEHYKLYYRWNIKAWMTTVLFQEWLRKFDTDMRNQQRQVLLLLDNAPTHAIKTIELTNVSVMFFPPNTTSHIQPMDAGIIAAFKKRYRIFQLGMALDREKNGVDNVYKVDIFQDMFWCRDSWKMVTSTSIKNFWYHTGLMDGIRQEDRHSIQEIDLSEMEEDSFENIVKHLHDNFLIWTSI